MMQRNPELMHLANQLLEKTYDYLTSQAVYLAVKLDLLSLLKGQYVNQISDKKLQRLLRCFCAYGFIEFTNQQYELTDLGRELQNPIVCAQVLQELGGEQWKKISRFNAEQMKNTEDFSTVFRAELFSQVSNLLMTKIRGYQLSKAIYLAVDLGLADYLTQDGISVEELAIKSGADINNLLVLMNILITNNIFSMNEKNLYITNPLGELLQSGEANFSAIVLHENPQKWLALNEIATCLNTDTIAFDQANGISFFEFLQNNPEQHKIFNQAMSSISQLIEITAISHQLQFSGIVMDMGGGEGACLAAILANNSTANGILFDLKDAIAQTSNKNHLPIMQYKNSGLCQFVGGSFFDKESIPQADHIILKRTLHDWDQDQAVTILKNCSAALKQNGQITIIEYLNNSNFMAKMDMLIMAIGGEIRSKETFQIICKEAGLEYHDTKALTPTLSAITMRKMSYANLLGSQVLSHSNLYASITDEDNMKTPQIMENTRLTC